jgi:putative heme-binding domain-containing protein
MRLSNPDDSFMDMTYRPKCIFILESILVLSSAVSAQAQSLPEGQGKAEFQRICGNCHSVSIATAQRMTQAQWTGVVNDMVSRGAQGSQQDLDNVVSYLSTHFGQGAPPAAGAMPPAAPAVAKETPLSEEQVARATGLIKTNGCLSCHRVAGAGSYVGPDLSDVGASYSPEQIRAALVSPNKDVAPQHRSIRLVTKDGKTITGRILNQDGFSVQIIDSSSELRSFLKSNLREFTIITANPMPAYGDKMSAEDLASIVQYLSSLKGLGNP